jgi:enamine deaminase RidA (YjgF/YER057c/UK114 family)
MSKDTISFVTVPGWPRPPGYANGAIGAGRVLHVAGQIGTDADGRINDEGGLPGELGQALDNVIAVVAAAGGEPKHIASMTIYVTDPVAYQRMSEEIGEVWRERMGKHFPAIALVGIAALYERSASVEIQAVAYLP